MNVSDLIQSASLNLHRKNICWQFVPYQVLYDVYGGIQLCHLLQFRPFVSIWVGYTPRNETDLNGSNIKCGTRSIKHGMGVFEYWGFPNLCNASVKRKAKNVISCIRTSKRSITFFALRFTRMRCKDLEILMQYLHL